MIIQCESKNTPLRFSDIFSQTVAKKCQKTSGGYFLTHTVVLYTVSQKNCAKLFLSELRQKSINFDNFWCTDSTKDRFIWGALIFHIT